MYYARHLEDFSLLSFVQGTEHRLCMWLSVSSTTAIDLLPSRHSKF